MNDKMNDKTESTIKYVKFWAAAVIEDGISEYKLEDNKQIYTQDICEIFNDKKEKCYIVNNDFIENNDTVTHGTITVEATPISREKSKIKYCGKFELNYKIKDGYEKYDDEKYEYDIKELHLSANIFTITLNNRWDSMRGWEIILNPGDIDEITLYLELGYYDSILKADADANKICMQSISDSK